MDNKKYADFLTFKRPKSLQINDLAALFCGVKKTVYTSLKDKEDEKAMNLLCSQFGFKKKILKEFKDIKGDKTLDILIGRDVKRMNLAAKAYLNGRPYEWGIWLDYPDCCVDFFGKWEKGDKNSLIKAVLEASYKGTFFDFKVNNVLNFYSRIKSEDLKFKHASFFKKNSDFFRLGLDFEPFLPWHPCSYFCKKSLKAAEEIYYFMSKYLPQTAEKRKKLLSSPILFKDDFDWFIINGNVKKNNKEISVLGSGVLPPLSLAQDRVFKKASKSEFPKDLNFFKKEKYILLPFSG